MHGFLADLVLVLHFAVVLFVVVGTALILAGGFRGWRWVRRRAFRVVHLAAIGLIAGQAWFGVVCPLTTLEMWLRVRAGEFAYSGGFIAHWVGRLLYHDAPGWVFALLYTLFALLVAWAWHAVPPERKNARR